MPRHCQPGAKGVTVQVPDVSRNLGIRKARLKPGPGVKSALSVRGVTWSIFAPVRTDRRRSQEFLASMLQPLPRQPPQESSFSRFHSPQNLPPCRASQVSFARMQICGVR
jgi:hypothetical protein